MTKPLILSLACLILTATESLTQTRDSLIHAIDEMVETAQNSPQTTSDSITISEDEYERIYYVVDEYPGKVKKIKKYTTDGDAGDMSSEVTLYLKGDEAIFVHLLQTCFVGDPITIEEKMYFHGNRLIKVEAEQRFYSQVREIDEICGSYGFSEVETLELVGEYLEEIKDASDER